MLNQCYNKITTSNVPVIYGTVYFQSIAGGMLADTMTSQRTACYDTRCVNKYRPTPQKTYVRRSVVHYIIPNNKKQ